MTLSPNGSSFANAQDYEIAEPKADAMIQSLRAFGYDLPTALADLIDNSISAGSKNIWLEFFWSGAASCIAVLDDGRGMSPEVLVNAMRPGSTSPLEKRDAKDLGRFGLGLKTARFRNAAVSLSAQGLSGLKLLCAAGTSILLLRLGSGACYEEAPNDLISSGSVLTLNLLALQLSGS